MKSIKLKEILFKDDVKYDKETNMYSQIMSGKGTVKDRIVYYPHWENACYYTWKNGKMIYRLGETIYGYTEKDNAYPDFIFRSKGYNDLIFDYPWDCNGKDEYIQGNRWNCWLLKEKNDTLTIDLMLGRINYPECLKDISINQKASADALFEYRKTLTDKPYEYEDEKGEIIKYFGKEDNYKEEMISKSKLKTWWEDYMYKEISERLNQTRPAEVLDDIDTSIRKNFIGWNIDKNNKR